MSKAIDGRFDTTYVTGNKNLYLVHCYTFGIARTIKGYAGDYPLATRGMVRGLSTFRAFPQYRCEAAKALRSEVCAAVRFNRVG
jgi:hypothetical protein